ncbi:MAG TPA: response regulator [bacterium]|jgi:two-component system chemotaxis response regulator CheY|nr:response regulator [bacterium]
MKALIVDDSRALRSILKRDLLSLGFEVDEAENGAVALERIRSKGIPDLMMLDWNMPEMNGLDLLIRLRRDEGNNALKIVMATSESEMAQAARALSAGADEYVIKPFTREALVMKLGILGLVQAPD